jgi:hypothetical protein
MPKPDFNSTEPIGMSKKKRKSQPRMIHVCERLHSVVSEGDQDVPQYCGQIATAFCPVRKIWTCDTHIEIDIREEEYGSCDDEYSEDDGL